MEKTLKEDKRIWIMRQEYFSVNGVYANRHKAYRPKLEKIPIRNHLTEHDRMGKKPSHATVPLSNAPFEKCGSESRSQIHNPRMTGGI